MLRDRAADLRSVCIHATISNTNGRTAEFGALNDDNNHESRAEEEILDRRRGRIMIREMLTVFGVTAGCGP